jgi:hypothetical protein
MTKHPAGLPSPYNIIIKEVKYDDIEMDDNTLANTEEEFLNDIMDYGIIEEEEQTPKSK